MDPETRGYSMNQQYVGIAVCQDCLMFAANGESEGAPEGFLDAFIDASRIGELIPSCSGEGECGCDSDNGYIDEWFSWSRCDYCGSSLGGTRYCATYAYPAHTG